MTSPTDLAVGDSLPPLEKHVDSIQLFRYSAITWNPHRIHYDREHAEREGHPDILVQAHFHGAVLQELLLDWVGPDYQLRELSWRNVDRATVEHPLHAGGTVTERSEDPDVITCEVWTKSAGNTCAEGTATVEATEVVDR